MMQRLVLPSLVAVASAGPAPGASWCPSAADFLVPYGGGHPEEQGWSISGGGTVATKAAYNLLGGFVEFDIDVSGVGRGNNGGVYTISPHMNGVYYSGGGFSPPYYCDGADPRETWCLEVDWIMSNGHCGGATSLHAIEGFFSQGCSSYGCMAEYHYHGNTSFHMKIEYGMDGTMTTTRDGQVINAASMSPHPGSDTWSVIKSTYESRGAVIYSKQFQGYAGFRHLCGQPGSSPLDTSVLSVKNLRIKGSVVQGPSPRVCGSDLETEVVNVV